MKKKYYFLNATILFILAACDSSNEYETDRQSSSIENNQKPRHQLFWKKHIRLTQYMITKKKVSSITEKQEQTLISYTQLDCEDRGYTLKYRGKDTWNVALNYINNK